MPNQSVEAEVTRDELVWLIRNLKPGEGSVRAPIQSGTPFTTVKMPASLAERFLAKRKETTDAPSQ